MLLYWLVILLATAGGETLAQAQDTTREAEPQVQAAPLPALDGSVIEPVTLVYETSIEAQGRQASMTVTRTVETGTYDGQPIWRIVDESESGMSGGADTVIVDRQTLAPLHRMVSGRGHLSVSYTDTSVTGTMEARGRSVSIDRSLDAPVLGNGPGLELALAGLPLAEDYSTPLRTFNPTQQSVQTMTFTVIGTRTVQVPAGTFKVYVAELTPSEEDQGAGETLYLKQSAPHYVVKGESDLPPQMGNGTATRVLTSME